MPKPDPPRFHFRFDAIGTAWDIETPSALSDGVRSGIARIVDDFDRAYSRFRDDSFVTELARRGGNQRLPGADEIFGLYDKLFTATDGRVTPLIGQALSDLGYDAAYSFVTRPGKAVPDYAEVFSHHSDTVNLKEPASIDIGAAGKGYLVDKITERVAAHTNDFIVDGSGDVAVGRVTSRIGLEHPADPSVAIGHVDLAGASLCGSGVNRRAWGDGLHHIIDPVTRKPVSSVLATWVIASDTLQADGLATALFFTEPDILLRDFIFSYVVMHADGSVSYSRDPRITLYD